ncbi:hypothetical protein J5N97_025496 [Dioscorea zingiberensis]|uniref:Uncharacterized protein n=1 Tax=Dioscorea zingiberensis TaxID=325984 RepID=A0A9D5C9B2_9LILI|nr:hypothetical protein J5N97_025496 [Dioscorea zingiberensis]
MSSSAAAADDPPDLICHLDSIHGMVDALTSIRWKRHQDAVMELSEHGIVVIVEESGCLQAKVYLKRELFLVYEYAAEGHPRFGMSLDLFVDGLNIFSALGPATVNLHHCDALYIYMLRTVDFPNGSLYAAIRTRIPDTISWDYNFEPTGIVPISFTVKSVVLKEAIEDLEWPGSSIQIVLQPDPPCVTFKGDGHGEFLLSSPQIDFPYYASTALLIAFQCSCQVAYWYKYKFLSATTSNIPACVLKANRGSKLTIGRGGMLKILHLVSVGRPGAPHPYGDNVGEPRRFAYIEFDVKAKEEQEDAPINDS